MQSVLHVIVVIHLAMVLADVIPLSNEQRQEMVDKHNAARASVSPPASDMMKAVWANDLEKLAADWVDKCVWKHPDREPGSPYRDLGQNLAMNVGYGLNFADLSDGWYNEIKYYTLQNNSCEPGRVCGHYTQMVWAASKEIGCAWKQCDNLMPDFSLPVFVCACQYRIAGNWVGQKPYQEGPSCSNCPAGTTCSENMCVDSSFSTIPPVTVQASEVISEQDKEDLIKQVNEWRVQVSPPAANMMQVSYSTEMEALAAEYAGMCMNKLPCPSTYPKYNPVGMTLAVAPGDEASLLGMAKQWWDARKQYNYKTNGCTGYCHHYKQLVWAATYEMGCAWSTCNNLQPTWKKPVKFLVCVYNYCGGFGNKRPYSDGPTCSNCFYGQKCVDQVCTGTPRHPPQKFKNGMHMLYW